MDAEKPKIAFYWCASCGGCDESILDLSEDILEFVEAMDIVFWPVALDFKTKDVEAMPNKSILTTMINGSIRISDTVSAYVRPNSHVSAWARPYAYVSIYDNGRYLGSTRVSGTIHVSGWSRNGWLDLSGSGYVTGQLTYTDPEEEN